MASCSEAQLGMVNSESFAELINSLGNLVCTNANTLLSDEKISMLVILHMNESFMMHKAEIKNLVLEQTFGLGVVVDKNPDGPLILLELVASKAK
jgi:hypothetical protein